MGTNPVKTISGVLLVAATLSLSATVAFGQDCCGTCGGCKTVSVDSQEQENTIVGLAAQAGTFNTLVTAIEAAGLKETLGGKGPFTVFAPSDEAFAKIPRQELQDLLRPENREKLAAILTYHVVPNEVLAGDVVKLKSAKTVNGQSLSIQVKDKKVFVDKIQVVKTDIKASNGVIHVIEEVLIPPEFKLLHPIVSSPGELITLAINRGVPLFNDGRPEACAALYEVTIQALLGLSEGELHDESITDLRIVLDKTSKEQDPVLKAWMLRHALDNAYIRLPEPEEKALSMATRPMLIDDFSVPNGISDMGTSWRFFSDRVMGGLSNGTSRYEVLDGKQCIRMQGEVSLENNGGFVQIALPLQPDERPFDASGYRGIRLWVRGNGLPYYIHLRTAQNRLPWQYFSAPLTTDNEWRVVDIPFSDFAGQSTYADLDTSILKRLAVVGAKKAFQADIAVSRVELYL